jgi:tetratricopeptide (TPR) repeat protein
MPQIVEPAQRAVRLHRMGAAFQRLGKRGQPDAYPEALSAYSEALQLLNSAADPVNCATVLKDIGDVHRAQENFMDARNAYEQAVEHMRRVPEEKYHLASMLIELGRIRLQIISAKQDPINFGDKPGLAGSSGDVQLPDNVEQVHGLT